MYLKLLAAAAALTLPGLAIADEPAATATTAPAAKEKKLCRYTPPPTGSNRPGKRKCRTAAEWKEIDRETGMVEAGTSGAPARSQPETDK